MTRAEYTSRCTEVNVLVSLIGMNVTSCLRPGRRADRLAQDVADIAKRFAVLAKQAITTAADDQRAVWNLTRDLKKR